MVKLKKIRGWLDNILFVAASILIFVLVLGAIWQVFTRFVLQDPSIITQEILRFSLIWLAMIGSAYVFGQDAHLSFGFFKDKMKGQAHVWLFRAIDLAVIVFALFVLVIGGYTIASATMAELSPILGIPMGYIYSILPISGILILFYEINNLLNRKPISDERSEYKWM